MAFSKKEKEGAAIRKRAQINKSNKTMFIFVALSSVVVSTSIVCSIMLFQRMNHMNRAIGRLQQTEKTLKENNAKIESLTSNVRALGSNESLLALKANSSDNALQVILDALPAEANASAFGASLQQKLLADQTVELLSVDPVLSENYEEVFVEDESGEEADITESTSLGTLNVRFTIAGDYANFKTVLDRLERSIRTIQVKKITIDEGGEASGRTMAVEAIGFYQLPKEILLKEEQIKP